MGGSGQAYINTQSGSTHGQSTAHDRLTHQSSLIIHSRNSCGLAGVMKLFGTRNIYKENFVEHLTTKPQISKSRFKYTIHIFYWEGSCSL